MTAPNAWRVLLPLPLPPFTFLPPHGFRHDAPEPGCRVVVPWQSGVRVGLLTGFEPLRGGAGLELREGVAVLDARPFVTPAALAVLEQVAAYTCAPPGTVLKDLLATGLNVPLTHQVRALAVIDGEPVADTWQDAAEVPLRSGSSSTAVRGFWTNVRSFLEGSVSRLLPLREGDAGLDGAARANQRRALCAPLDAARE